MPLRYMHISHDWFLEVYGVYGFFSNDLMEEKKNRVLYRRGLWKDNVMRQINKLNTWKPVNEQTNKIR